MDEDNGASPGKDDVGLAGQIPAMKTEAKTEGMQKAADDQLRYGVPTWDARHEGASRLGRSIVGHIRQLGDG